MLPKTAEYALRATVWLGRTPEKAESADQLAKAIQVPQAVPSQGAAGSGEGGSGPVAVGTWRRLPAGS